VAGATRDLRKGLDICHRAVELVESETRQRELKMKQQQQQEEPKSPGEMTKPPAREPLMENMNLNPPHALISTFSSETAAKQATIAHVASISS